MSCDYVCVDLYWFLFAGLGWVLDNPYLALALVGNTCIYFTLEYPGLCNVNSPGFQSLF